MKLRFREYRTVNITLYMISKFSCKCFPAVVCRSHGPFTWGKSAAASVENALILEEIAKMASRTERIAGERPIGIESYLLDKHYLRKHGANAYYGQKK